MRRFLQRYRDILALTGIVAIGVLVVANSWKYGLVSAGLLSRNKDAISAATSIIGSLTLLIGAFLTYYRFFRGRTFSARAEIAINASIHQSGGDFYIHAVEVELHNVGASAIWFPELVLAIRIDGGKQVRRISQWWEPGAELSDLPPMRLVEPGESASFLAHESIPIDANIVTYVAIVKSERRAVWQKVATVSNVLGERTATGKTA